MNVQVVHKPVKGAKRVFPTLRVGEVLQVSAREADALVATGAFQRVQQEEPAAEPQAAPARGRRGSKAADAAGGES